jgi:hypothetical protein
MCRAALEQLRCPWPLAPDVQGLLQRVRVGPQVPRQQQLALQQPVPARRRGFRRPPHKPASEPLAVAPGRKVIYAPSAVYFLRDSM